MPATIIELHARLAGQDFGNAGLPGAFQFLLVDDGYVADHFALRLGTTAGRDDDGIKAGKGMAGLCGCCKRQRTAHDGKCMPIGIG